MLDIDVEFNDIFFYTYLKYYNGPVRTSDSITILRTWVLDTENTIYNQLDESCRDKYRDIVEQLESAIQCYI